MIDESSAYPCNREVAQNSTEPESPVNNVHQSQFDVLINTIWKYSQPIKELGQVDLILLIGYKY